MDDLEYELVYLSANGKDLNWMELACPNCKTEVTVVAINDQDLLDFEIVTCPACECEIKKIRADLGYRIVEVRK